MRAPKDTSKTYFILLVVLVILSSTFRLWKPNFSSSSTKESPVEIIESSVTNDPILAHAQKVDSLFAAKSSSFSIPERQRPAIGFRFRNSYDYVKGFPDMNDVQLETACRLGISQCKNRKEAALKSDSLIYIGECPYYVLDNLSHSTPYLIPRAARLLKEISCSFLDSLSSRGMPYYRLLVTSVLRTNEDVQKLKKVNVNASENSCHQHGTTFDICYNKFFKVVAPNDSTAQQVWPAELKQILAEVIDDQRRLGTCYVKYEYRQACFHITAR